MGSNKISKGMWTVIMADIIRKYTNPDHHLLQSSKDESDTKWPSMTGIMKDEYGIDIDRKTVSRNLVKLRDQAGMDIIITDKDGFWLNSRDFSIYEQRLLMDSVITNRYISQKDAEELVAKISSLSGEFFISHLENVYVNDSLGRTTNTDVYKNIQEINDAVNNSLLIEFEAIPEYGTGFDVHLVRCAPKCIVLIQQRYYLVVDEFIDGEEGKAYYPIDNIRNLRITDSHFWWGNMTEEEKKDIKRIASANWPMQFKKITIVFYAPLRLYSHAREAFGFQDGDVNIGKRRLKKGESKNELDYRYVVKTSKARFIQFVREHLGEVDIVSPMEWREDFKADLKEACKLYDVKI